MQTSSNFHAISLHNKCDRIWSSLQESEYKVKFKSRVARRLQTYHLRKLGNFKKTYQMKCLIFKASTQRATQKANLNSCARKLRKIRCVTFFRETCHTLFRELVQYIVRDCSCFSNLVVIGLCQPFSIVAWISRKAHRLSTPYWQIFKVGVPIYNSKVP